MKKPIATNGVAAVLVLLTLAVAAGVAQAQRGAAPPRAPVAGTASAYTGPRTPDRKPDLNGIWQVLGTRPLESRGPFGERRRARGLQRRGGRRHPLPAVRRWPSGTRTFSNRLMADPLRKCYMPGVPRATYLPFPFEITQTPNHILIAYEFAHATRTIFLDGTPHMEDLDFWMGDARGKWEGDTLVVDTVSLGDKTWFDQAGNFHSDALKVVERFTPIDATHINYEVTIDDAKVFTRPWKMNMIIYRRLEKNLELLDYECAEHVYEKLFKERAASREGR